MNAATEIKICHNPNCGYQTDESLAQCPKCSRPLLTAFQFRLVSSVLIFCGLLLTAGAVALIMLVASYEISEVKGGAATVTFIYGLLGLILALGLSVLAAGSWQVIFGRANARLVYILLTVLLLLLVIVGVGRSVLSLFAS